MEVGSLIDSIATVGFPIVMCLVMMWYIKELNRQHKEETEKFTDALNTNTVVLQKLCDKLDVEREV